MEDILDDPGYRNLSAQDKVAWIDLLARFNLQRAHRTGNMIVLPWSRALSTMGAQNRAGALRRCSVLARFVSAHFARVPEGLLCYIPKWSKLQGLTPTLLRSVSDATPSPTPTPTPTVQERDSSPTEIRDDPSSQEEKNLGADAPNPPGGLGEDAKLLNLLCACGRDRDHASDRLLELERELWLNDHIAPIKAAAEENGKRIPGTALAWWGRYLAAKRRPGEYGATPVREYYARARDQLFEADRIAERKMVEDLDRETEAEGIGFTFEGLS